MTIMNRIALITCRTWPDLSPSDQLYAEALARLGHQMSVVPWNDPVKASLLEQADTVVFRSNYDYHDDWEAFEPWLDDLIASGRRIFNAPALLRWNLRKSYMFDVSGWGIPTPRSFPVSGGLDELRSLLEHTGWDKAVVKPLYGGNGRGVMLIDRNALEDDWLAISDIAAKRHLIVQEFLPEITAGEVSMIYVNGYFTHAVRKKPREGEFRVNSAFKPTRTLAQPREADIETGRELISRLVEMPLYARIDGVQRPDCFVVLEVELHEPHLFIDYFPSCAEVFAAATHDRLLR